MKTASIILMSLILSINGMTEIDFGKGKDGATWQVVNDGVMGGVSKSTKSINANSLVFKGTVSLENNGGFASIRAPYGKYDLSQHENIEIKYRLSGQVASMTFDKDYPFYIPNYRLQLTDVSGNWAILNYKIADLAECYLGEPTGKKISSEIQKNIIRMGFIVANKKAGDFELEVEYIKFE